MNKETETILGKAKSRNMLIPYLLLSGEYYIPRDEIKTAILRFLALKIITDIKVSGIDNLRGSFKIIRSGL